MEDYAERWIETTDWGGLVKANEEFYSFVLNIEEVARSFLTVDLLRKNQKEDMREIFQFKLKTVPVLSSIPVSLSRNMPNWQLSDKLFKKNHWKVGWLKGLCICYSIYANFIKENQLIAKRDEKGLQCRTNWKSRTSI